MVPVTSRSSLHGILLNEDAALDHCKVLGSLLARPLSVDSLRHNYYKQMSTVSISCLTCGKLVP